MIHKVALLFCCLALSACAGVSRQQVRMPEQEVELEDPTGTRIYFLRKTQTYGKSLAVTVRDGDTEIGRIAQQDYLCWEGFPGRRLITAVLERRSIDGGDVESYLDLPGEPGQVYYCAAECEAGNYGKLKIELLSPEDGRALLKHRQPADEEKP
jgi:hypothetical protein